MKVKRNRTAVKVTGDLCGENSLIIALSQPQNGKRILLFGIAGFNPFVDSCRPDYFLPFVMDNRIFSKTSGKRVAVISILGGHESRNKRR